MREIITALEYEANFGKPMETDPLFSDCIEEWLSTKTLDARPNTVQSYKVYARSQIIPRLGYIKLGDLTRRHIQEYFSSLADTLSASTLKKHRVIIRGALESAALDGLIDTKTVLDLVNVTLPKAKKFTGQALTEEDANMLLACATKEREPVRAAVILALCYGLRRSEICGLRWKDVDIENKKLHICNTVTEYAGKSYEAEATKTEASRRVIYLTSNTIPYLDALRHKRIAQGATEESKICAHEDGQEARPEYISRAVKKFLGMNRFEGLRLHDLRHTAASLLARHVPPKQVQAFLGHEDISTTLNIYTHINDKDKESTSIIMGGILTACRTSEDLS